MKREILLERIDKLKQIMPWYVLEYYQSKLAVPYSFTTLYEYLKEYDRFFSWFWSLVFQTLIKCLIFLYLSWKICLRKTWNLLFFIYVNDLCWMLIQQNRVFHRQLSIEPYQHFLVFTNIWPRKLKMTRGEPLFLSQCNEESFN